MPGYNGFNEEDVLWIPVGVDIEDLQNQLGIIEKTVNKVSKNNKLEIDVAKSSSKEVKALQDELENVQKELTSLRNQKVPKSTFQKLKSEISSRFSEIETKLQNLQNSLSQIIKQVPELGDSLNLNNWIDQFGKANTVIKQTSDALEEISKITNSDNISLTIKKDEVEEYKQAAIALQQANKELNKSRNEEDNGYDRLASRGIKDLIDYYEQLQKEIRDVTKEIKNLADIYDKTPEGSDLVPLANLQKKKLELASIGVEVNKVKQVIEDLVASSDGDKYDLNKIFSNQAFENYLANIIKSINTTKEEASETFSTFKELFNTISSAKRPLVSPLIKEATETEEKLERTYTTALRLSDLLANGKIEILIDGDVDKLRGKIEDQLAELQEKLNKEALVVPIKIVVGNTPTKSENPLKTAETVIDKTKRSTQEIVANADAITEKGLKQVLKTATEGIESFVKDVKNNLESIFKQKYYLNVDISDEEYKKLETKLFAENIAGKLDITKNLEHANEVAKELAKSIKEVLGLIETENNSLLGIGTNYKSKSKKAQQTEYEQLLGKLDEYKKGAKEVKDRIQKEVFKAPIYLDLDVKNNTLDKVRSKVDNANLGQSLRESLTRAESIAESIVQILTPLNGLEITVKNGKGSVQTDKLSQDFDNLYKALFQILNALEQIQKLIPRIRTKEVDNDLKQVKVDFTEIVEKVNELMTKSEKLVSDLRSDINTIDNSFKELGESINKALDEKNINTIVTELNGLDLSKLEGTLSTIATLLIGISNSLDGINSNIKAIDSNSLDTQWRNIAEKFREIANYTDDIDLRKSKKQAEEIVGLFAKYKDSGGLNSLSMLTDNVGTLEKLQKIATKTQGTNFSILDNERLKDTKEQMAQLDSLLSSITSSLSSIDGLSNVSKVFNALNIKDDVLAKIQKLPDELKLIADKLREIDTMPYSGFMEQLSKITEQAEGLKSLAEILKHSQKQIQTAMDIANGGTELKAIKKEQDKIANTLNTQFKNASKDNRKVNEIYSAEQVSILEQIGDKLKLIAQYKDSVSITSDGLSAYKQLNSEVEQLFDSLSKVEQKSKEYTTSIEQQNKILKNQMNEQRSRASRFEREYYSSWGYGSIPTQYGSEYGTILEQIKQKVQEVKALTSDKTKIYTEEDVAEAKQLNVEIEKLFVKLKEVNKVAKSTQITNMQNKIASYIEKNTRLTSGMYNQLVTLFDRLNSGAEITDKELKNIATDFNRIQYSAKVAGVEGAGFLDAIKNKLKYGWAQSIAMFFSFYDIVRYAREISSAVTELNTNLIELAKVSDTSIGKLYNNFSDFADIAKETGGTINDIIQATADWSRNGYNLSDSKELARLSSIFQNIGDGLTADQSNEYLVSILKGFNLQAKDTISIMDAINNVSNNAASSVSNIGEALERSSSAFGAANTSLNQSVALLTTANEVLQNPETVGTAFKSMSARLRSSTTELEDLGEETTLTTSKLRALVQALTGVDIQEDENTFKSIYDILLEIGKEWKNLTDVEQASLSEALFGKRNAQVGFAILNNVERLEEIYSLASDSAGSAMEEQEKYLQGVQYRIDQFQASVENLANTFMSSDFLKGIIASATQLVNLLETIIDKLGTIPALVSVIGTAIGSKHNMLFDLANMGLSSSKKSLPFTANTDISTLASGKQLSDAKRLIDEYNTSFMNLERITKNTQLTHEQFITEVAKGNPILADYLNSLGSDSAGVLKEYQSQLVKTTIKTTALRLGTMLLQGVLLGLASAIISSLVKAIDDWVHANERAIEKGEQAKQVIEETQDALKSQQDIVKESGKRFAELSQGIDQLTGKNVSLSDEDYQEFLDISNELLKVFPSLSHHYDENGNAIVDLDGNVNTIVNSLNTLLEVEEKLANQKILDTIPDVYEGVIGQAKQDYDTTIANLQSEIENFNSLVQYKKDDFAVSGIFTDSDIEIVDKLERKLVELGIVYERINDEQIKVNSVDLSENLDEIFTIYDSQLNKLQNELVQKSQEMSQQIYSSMSPYIAAQLSEDAAYNKLSDDVQVAMQNIFSGLDWAKYKEEYNDDWSKTWADIKKNIVDVISNDSELQEGLKLTLSTKTEFNNNEISWGEYKERLLSLIKLLNESDLSKDTKKSILLSLGFELDEDNNIVNTIENNIRQQMKDAKISDAISQEIINGLNSDELNYLYNNAFDWSKILNISDSQNAIKIIKAEITSLTSVPFEIKLDTETIKKTSSGIESLQAAYQELYDAVQEGKIGEELAFSFADLDDLKSKLVDVEGNIVDLGDVWTNFYDVMSDGTHTFEEMKDALNQVLTAYVNSTISINNFDKAQADAISTQLQLAGVTKESADAYVQAMTERANAIRDAEQAGIDLVNQLDDEAIAFIEEAEISELARQQLALYSLEKQIANGLVIQTSADCDNLIQLASIAGATTEQLARLIELKAQLANLEINIASAGTSAAATALESEANRVRREIQDVLVEDVVAEAKAKAANFKFDDKKINGSKSGGGGSKAEKEEDLWKKAYEKELADLDHLHEMEIINDIQYYEERERLNEKYFANSEKYAEDYAKNQEEIYKGLKSAYKSYLDEMLDYYKTSLDNGIMTLQEYSTKAKGLLDQLYSAGLIDSSTYFTKLADYYGNIVSQYDKAINAAQRVIKKRIKALEDEKKALEDSYELKKDAIRTQINTIQAQIDATNKEIEKLEEANKARQDAIDMQKALYNLNRAENQRTQMVYKSDLGFVYEANTQDIKAAQEELENLEYERMISQLEKTVSTLEEQIEGLEDQIESLEAELDGLTENIDKQIEKMQDYSDRLGEVANAWTEAQEDMVAASIWGSDWQNNILDLNETTLVEFTKSYIDMQQKQADALAKATEANIANYNAQIEALNAWKRAQAEANETPISNAKSTTTSTGNSKNVNKSVNKTNASDVGNKGSSNRAVKYAWKGSDGKVHYEYGSGTDRAKPGYHEVAETGDEIILDNYGNAYLAKGHQLHQFEGGEKVYNPNETNELLRGQYLPIDEILPNYSDLVSKVVNKQFSSPIRNSSHVISSQKDVKPMKVDNSISINIGDIHLTEVDNVSQFAQAIVNKLPNALLQELNRK